MSYASLHGQGILAMHIAIFEQNPAAAMACLQAVHPWGTLCRSSHVWTLHASSLR